MSGPRRHFDLVVVGGGSGGFAAAWSAAGLGLEVLLVEKGPCLGGNAVRSGVNCWEAGAGGTGVPFDLYRKLCRVPLAVGIYTMGRHGGWFDAAIELYRFPGGENVIDSTRRYVDTLRRHGMPQGDLAGQQSWCREHIHGLPFEPQCMAEVMWQALEGTAKVQVRLGTGFTRVHVGQRGNRRGIDAIELVDGSKISAWGFIDGTADAHLAAAAGCPMMQGQDPQSRFGEPDAPLEPNDRINGVTLVFRVTPKPESDWGVDAAPAELPEECWWRPDGWEWMWCCMNHYPNGDRNINMLPTMEGSEFQRLGYAAAHAECQRRVWAYWRHLQRTYDEFRRYRLSWLAPALGVRESRRVRGEYVLTELDLLAGINCQSHEDIICLSDHAMDTHGSTTGRRAVELSEPYGVPLRCLIPQGFDNLMMACRAASFSSLAASSCRLSRTMMQLGQAAGTAAAAAFHADRSLAEAPADTVRNLLRRQHVQLDHPMPGDLRAWLVNADPANDSTLA